MVPLPVSKISGIGPKSQKLLNELGIKTIRELATYPVEQLVRHFGKNGVWMWDIANGLDKSEVIEHYERKSVSAEHTFEVDVSDYGIVHKTLELLSDEVINTLTHEHDVQNSRDKVRFTGFETITGVKTLKGYIDSQEVLNNCCKELFDSICERNRKIRLVGVRVSNLRKLQPEQKDLLTWIES